MSDHWNSLANLLGTPSLSPQSKKGTDGAGTKAKEIAQPQESTAIVETSKSVAKEPSKLRSGWDAVTSFFGIQSTSNTESKADDSRTATEPAAKQTSAPPREPRSETKTASPARSGKKSGKPSFWNDDAEGTVEPSEPKAKQAAAPSQPDVFAVTDDEPVVSFGGRKRERNERKENTRPPRESRETRETRETNTEKSESQRQPANLPAPFPTASAVESDDVDGPVERRSQRRAPRRGRSDDLDEGAVESAPSRSSNDRREPPANRRSRSAEPSPRVENDRDDVAEEPVLRSEDSRSNDRPARGSRDKAGRDRSPRNRNDRDRPERSERPERSDRSDRSEREPVERSEVEAPVKDTAERENVRRGRDRRTRNDDSRTEPERRRPDSARRAPVEEVGFGAGLQDSDDDSDFVSADTDDVVSVDRDESSRATEGARRGRNQRRGRRSSGRATPSADDAERMEADESEKKFIKVPSWIEALDGILQSNMDNHQRNNHGRDRNRGRGPRNNDR